jgi:uncharacterized protein (TIGR02145 family)
MKIYLSLLFLLSVIVSIGQQTGRITDARDGKVYKTVVIGTQTWMAENLNVSTFRNGDPIPEAKTDEDWEKAGDEGKPAWCYYRNDTMQGAEYGKLYNWYAVNDPRVLAPSGWHVPTDNEWTTLSGFLGNAAGTKMKSAIYISDNPTNSSGFNGLIGGLRIGSGFFPGMNEGYWWSSTESNTIHALSLAFYRVLNVQNVLMRNHGGKKGGLSVRCVRD